MANQLAKTYVVLSGAILVIVGVAGFYRREMFHLTFPLAHNLFHLLSGIIALWMALAAGPNGVRQFGLIFGAIYTTLAIAGFAGLRNLGPIELGLNPHYNVIHLGIGVLSLTAGVLGTKRQGEGGG